MVLRPPATALDCPGKGWPRATTAVVPRRRLLPRSWRHGGPLQARWRYRPQQRTIGLPNFNDMPAPEPATWPGIDLQPRHTQQEGFRVLVGLRVGCRHSHQFTRECQSLRLGGWGQRPVMPDALEARRQHILRQPADGVLASTTAALARTDRARVRHPYLTSYETPRQCGSHRKTACSRSRHTGTTGRRSLSTRPAPSR